MKKIFLILVCIALALLPACPTLAEEGDETYAWSEPGEKNFISVLPARREIRDEAEAYAYALELWPMISSKPLPEGTRELDIDRHDTSYHFAILNMDDQAQYNVGFLSSGVIQHISRRDKDPLRFSGERKEGSGLDAGAWEKAKGAITEWVEKISPGVLELVEPLNVYSILDNGETQRLFISALPLDPEYDGNLHIVAILYADGRCEVIDYSCYGAG